MADLRTLITDLRRDSNRQFELMNRQFTELRGDRNRQFVELREDTNRRFEAADQKDDRHFIALDQKIDRQFAWVVGIQVALLLGVVGALVGAYFK